MMSFEDLCIAFRELVEERRYGKYAAVVDRVDDPKSVGRLTAKVPEIFGEDMVSGWAMPAAPIGGGKDRGFFALPQRGDTIWIEFEAGDIARPIWSGSFWGAPRSAGGQDDIAEEAGAETPAGPAEAGGPGQNLWKTKAGHLLSLDDNGGLVVVAAGSGARIDISSNGEVVIDAKSIKLGKNAAQKAVLGDALMSLFNSHTHPTGVGPSGPPTQPMTPQHLSNVTKTE